MGLEKNEKSKKEEDNSNDVIEKTKKDNQKSAKEGISVVDSVNDINNESKAYKDVVGEENQLNRLCRPHMRQSLLKVLEKMIPADYVSFMMTNKEMMNVCTSVKKMPLMHKIRRVYGLKEVWEGDMDQPDEEEFIYFLADDTFHFIENKQLEALRSLPHSLVAQDFYWEYGLLRSEELQAIISLMEDNKVKKIDEVCIDGRVACWDELIEMTKTYKASRLEINSENVNTLTMANLEQIFQSKTLELFSSYRIFPEAIVIASSLPNLNLRNYRLSSEGCMSLVQRWVNGFSLEAWTFRSGPSGSDLSLMFVMSLNLSVLRFDFCDPLPTERPLVIRHSDTSTFWVLREDGEIMRIGWENNWHFVLHRFKKDEKNRWQPPPALLQ